MLIQSLTISHAQGQSSQQSPSRPLSPSDSLDSRIQISVSSISPLSSSRFTHPCYPSVPLDSAIDSHASLPHSSSVRHFHGSSRNRRHAVIYCTFHHPNYLQSGKNSESSKACGLHACESPDAASTTVHVSHLSIIGWNCKERSRHLYAR